MHGRNLQWIGWLYFVGSFAVTAWVCKDTDMTDCVTNGACIHDSKAWLSTCKCLRANCTIYMGDVCDTAGNEHVVVDVPTGINGFVQSQKSEMYAQRKLYKITLKAPQSEKISLKFTSVLLDGYQYGCPNGNLQIFDGTSADDAVRKWPVTGNNGLCNIRAIPSEINSTANALTIAFTTYGRESKRGFNATFQVSGPVHGGWSEWGSWSNCSAGCESNGTMLRERVCDNPKPKFGGAECPGKSIDTKYCRNDTKCKPKVCAKGNYMGCARNANCAEKNGELICTCRNTLCKVYMEDSCAAVKKRSVRVIGRMGKIRSQTGLFYRIKQTCRLTIQVPDGEWAFIHFTSFDFGGTTYCDYGHLQVFNGKSFNTYSDRYPDQDHSGFCNPSNPPNAGYKSKNIIVASGKYLTLEMDTSGLNNYKPKHVGFTASFKSVASGYVISYLTEEDIRIIAFTAMAFVFLTTIIGLTIWCIVRQKKRKKRLRDYNFQYRNVRPETVT